MNFDQNYTFDVQNNLQMFGWNWCILHESSWNNLFFSKGITKLDTFNTWYVIKLRKMEPLLPFNCLWPMAHLMVTNIMARSCNCSFFSRVSSWLFNTRVFWQPVIFNHGFVCIYWRVFSWESAKWRVTVSGELRFMTT